MNKIILFLVSWMLVLSLVFSTSCADAFPPINPTPDDEGSGDHQDSTIQPGEGEEGNTENDGNKDDNTTDEGESGGDVSEKIEVPAITRPSFNPSSIPAYNNSKSYVLLNNNVPHFSENQIVTDCYEYYSPLDSLGRCGVAVACLGRELMPTSNRESISSVSPSGWHGNAIYERSHLIAHALAGEDANKNNLITGTYDLNGVMQEFETLVRDYIKETDNHVMYRVDPIFTANNLVCIGVIMEAYSVEDNGAGISFNIFIYNAQDDIIIDYATGDYVQPQTQYTYIINKSNYKIHKAGCTSVLDMKEENKIGTTLSYAELIAQLKAEGRTYSNCGKCHPENG